MEKTTTFNEDAVCKRSRTAYAAQCTFEYLIGLLITDAFLAKLLTNIGISDSVIGIISSFISFSFLFQLMSIGMVSRMKNVKGTVIFFDCFSQLLYICLYCVPFMNASLEVKTGLAIIFILLAYASKYLVAAILFKWANSYVEPDKRGSFSAVKEMVSLFCGMGFSLVVGFIVDKYEAAGNIKYGFMFLIILLAVLNVFNFISLMGIKNGKITDDSNKVSTKETIKNTLGNKNFRHVIVLLSIYAIATHLTSAFMGTFKTKDLMLSVGLVQLINAVANGCRMLFSVPLGKYSDKKSYARGFELALFIAAAGYLANVFTTNATWWLVIVFTVLYSVSVGGTNANKFNITYSYVKSDYIAQAMAIQNSISGVLGFLASLVGSIILSKIQENGNMFLGIPVYAQQVLSAISLILIIMAIIYDKIVVEKQKAMIQ
ncbi:MAG: MFS transporter [Clostridia bacterium]|nr:MFS transporter [Clostridia bacterium]